jgi:hypothetical protein
MDKYNGLPGTAAVTRMPNMIAAVAESAPTMRWRDEQKMVKTTMGIKIVYIPVIIGIPAILAYPITSGMNIAAITMPAMISGMNRDRSSGNKPPNKVSLIREVKPDMWISPLHLNH